MKKLICLSACLVLIMGGLNTDCLGQKIVSKVNIMLEKMPIENQTKLSFLQRELESYLNDYEWSEDEFQYDLNCELAIAFDEAKTISFEDRYTATIIITNTVDLQYADKRWTFALQPNESLRHSSSFHPFTSLIDFYVNMILAREYDKLYEYGGDKYYDAAYQINELAKFNTQYYKGWDKRTDLITSLRADNNKPYRKLLFHFNTGYYFYEMGDPENAVPHLKNAVILIKSIPKNKRDRFFEVNYTNFLNALKGLKLSDEAKYIETFKPKEK